VGALMIQIHSTNTQDTLLDNTFSNAPIISLDEALDYLTKSKDPFLLCKLLPLLYNLRGRPYTLIDHWYFEEAFRIPLSPFITYKCARQVSKTQTMAAKVLMLAALTPYLAQMIITPLFTQVKNISQNYINSMIADSPNKSLFYGNENEATNLSLLQKTLPNMSRIHLSFASRDLTRTRSFNAQFLYLDEFQDFQEEFIPILEQVTTSYSQVMILKSGTPKGQSNPMAKVWEASSQAEWYIRCEHCAGIKERNRGWNIPTAKQDLLYMIGPVHQDISDDCPGLVCRWCAKPLRPRPMKKPGATFNPKLHGNGTWVHAYKDRAGLSPGYHVSQPIMPMHYSHPVKWMNITGALNGDDFVSFLNETCGETCDQGGALITEQELKMACDLKDIYKLNAWPCPPYGLSEEYLELIDQQNYLFKVLSVDWGHGGRTRGTVAEQRTSFTKLAILGFRLVGDTPHIDVLWGKKLINPFDAINEAKDILAVFATHKCHYIAHDFGGAGDLRLQIFSEIGGERLLNRVYNMAYTKPATYGLIKIDLPDDLCPHRIIRVDKSRSFGLTIGCIKERKIHFFDDQFGLGAVPGLVQDFLNLADEKTKSMTGTDYYIIRTKSGKSDDFAQAVNIGSVCCWLVSNVYPKLVTKNKYIISRSVDFEDPYEDGGDDDGSS
jgi:hypothetical protein